MTTAAASLPPGEACYAIVQPSDSSEPISIDSLRAGLEKGPDEARISIMKTIISGLLNGETSLAAILMPVIRYVVPTRSKPLKRMLLFFLEVCPKCSSDGRLLPEIILVCNAIRSDLLHPNEYVRGAALRMVCKLRHAELLEPLMPSCLHCLDHRHPYVRKNAVLALYSIYNHDKDLIPNAPSVIYDFIQKESDMACRRDALMVLQNTAPELAISFLASVAHLIPTFDENLQLAVIEILRKEARANPAERKKFLALLYALLQAPDAAVKFEAATSLTSLTVNPVAVRASLQCYIQLLNKTPSNNVKIIVLERVSELVEVHERLDDELALDLLRSLATADIEVRRSVCNLAMELTSPRNVEQVIVVLRKELVKASDVDLDASPDYRQLVIQTIHACAMRYPFCIAASVHSVLEFLCDPCYSSAVEVAVFVREAMERFPALREPLVDRLVPLVSALKSGKVMRGVLWIFGEHAVCENATAVLQAIRSALGDVMQEHSGDLHSGATQHGHQQGGVGASGATDRTQAPEATVLSPLVQTPISTSSVMPLVSAAPGGGVGASSYGHGQQAAKVLPDGTYASQTALSPQSVGTSERQRRPPLQALLQNSDYFTATVLSTCLTKICLRLREAGSKGTFAVAKANEFAAEALQVMVCLLQQGLQHNMDEDSCLRVQQCIGTVCASAEEEDADISRVYLEDCRNAFAEQLEAAGGPMHELTPIGRRRAALAAKKAASKYKIEEPIQFSMLRTVRQMQGQESDLVDEYDVDLDNATTGRVAVGAGAADGGRCSGSGIGGGDGGCGLDSTAAGEIGGGGGGGGGRSGQPPLSSSMGHKGNKLKRIMQLTGFSDEVYAEAYVHVNRFDIILDVLIVNQTETVMQNMTVEFATLGDLKLVERPSQITLAPRSYHTTKIHIKVSSTETGVIFGNIVYDVAALDTRCVILNDIYIDIMDYIVPAQCSETRFRAMWVEFEWENKIYVHSMRASMLDYLKQVQQCTNMACLTTGLWEPVTCSVDCAADGDGDGDGDYDSKGNGSANINCNGKNKGKGKAKGKDKGKGNENAKSSKGTTRRGDDKADGKLQTVDEKEHEQCGVLSANLYARSVFGEDALANICIEKLKADSPITGHIRIRSKTQGIALSLGDKISHGQKNFMTGGNVVGSGAGAVSVNEALVDAVQ